MHMEKCATHNTYYEIGQGRNKYTFASRERAHACTHLLSGHKVRENCSHIGRPRHQHHADGGDDHDRLRIRLGHGGNEIITRNEQTDDVCVLVSVAAEWAHAVKSKR